MTTNTNTTSTTATIISKRRKHLQAGDVVLDIHGRACFRVAHVYAARARGYVVVTGERIVLPQGDTSTTLAGHGDDSVRVAVDVAPSQASQTRWTIADIAEANARGGFFFFSAATMRSFGDTLRSFAVRYGNDGSIWVVRVRRSRKAPAGAPRVEARRFEPATGRIGLAYSIGDGEYALPPVLARSVKRPALAIRQNAWGNWRGYRGGRSVELFMGDSDDQEQQARAWARAQADIISAPYRLDEVRTGTATTRHLRIVWL